MSKRVLTILSDGFEDIEAIAPIDILRRIGCEVVAAGLNNTTVKGAYAVTVELETKLSDIHGEFDAIVLPGGGKNAKSLASDERVVELVRTMHGEGKLVAAICASVGEVLGEAGGVLGGKNATGFPGVNDKIRAGGATLSNELVTRDGNIITAQGAGAAVPFGLAVAAYLAGDSAADELAKKWWIQREPEAIHH